MLVDLKILLICLLVNLSFGLTDDNCGFAGDAYGLIFGGNHVREFDWPWIVAIFHKVDGVNFKYIFGGTLISRRKVITAAHCLHEKPSRGRVEEVKNIGDLLLKLGAFNLNETERNVVTVEPASLSIHPDWLPNDLRYDADIAVIELPYDVKISKFIRPICIWERRRGAPGFTEGIIVGWGQTETLSHEEIARVITIPVISNEQCFLDERKFAAISSNRTFCGGAKSGKGPCKGDSGSGLVFKSDDKFYLGGIVSASTLDIYKKCDVKNYAVYTEVFKFNDWLRNRKFREKSQSEVACDRFKSGRPKRPSWFKPARVESNEAKIGEFPHMAILAR